MKDLNNHTGYREETKIKLDIRLSLVLFLCVFQLIFWGCSTEKNAFINKSYHYTTARFNGYFHGREAFKEAKKALYKEHEDNYEEVLQIFRHGDKTQAEAQYGNLDRAISKGKKMIERHSMRFKKKSKLVEHNKMIDDCYLLVGRSYFLKMQYDSAAQTFKYLQSHFETSPLFYDIQLDLVKTFIYQENFVDAETKFVALEEDKNFPEKLKDEYNVLRALYFIDTDDHQQAIEYLQKALSSIKKTKLKVRLKYILAQLHRKTGNLTKASALFAEVAKKAVYYEMEFNAKLSLAKTHQGKDSKKIIGILEKMLKDKKNKEFKDQIYYTLAQVHEKKGNKEKAVEYYLWSAQASVNNPKQKAQSYLAVAQYKFEIPEYLEAQMFYDSALISLPKSYPNYDGIKDKADNLTALVEQLNTIEREDSLQKVAGMSEADRLLFIDELIAKVQQEEEKKQMAEQAKLEQIKAATALQQNTGGWLFDNPKMLASANAEFITIFGNRILEDNWRRSDKSTSTIQEVLEDNENPVNESGEPVVAENQTVSYYLKGLPFDPEQIDSSNAKIKYALYQAATIFKNKLNDIERSNFYFEELNRRFPKNANRPKSLYQLYRNYKQSGDKENAAVKKSLILSDYPNSEYALLIKYPNRGAEEEKLLEDLNVQYQQAYELYQKENYEGVTAMIDAVKARTKDNPLQANFDLLSSFVLGKTKGKEAFEKALKTFIRDHQGSSLAEEATIIMESLNAMRMQKMATAQAEKQQLKEFDTTLVAPYYYAFIFSPAIVDSADLLMRFEQVNKIDFAKNKLTTAVIPYTGQEKLLLVKSFEEIAQAKEYANEVQENILNKTENTGNLHFVISAVNYQKLIEFKEEEQYLKFYKERY